MPVHLPDLRVIKVNRFGGLRPGSLALLSLWWWPSKNFSLIFFLFWNPVAADGWSVSALLHSINLHGSILGYIVPAHRASFAGFHYHSFLFFSDDYLTRCSLQKQLQQRAKSSCMYSRSKLKAQRQEASMLSMYGQSHAHVRVILWQRGSRGSGVFGSRERFQSWGIEGWVLYASIHSAKTR